MSHVPEKVIPVPPFGRVDVSRYIPLLNTEPVQLMRYRTQLGLCDQCFPNAKHTRFAHSIATLQVARKFMRGMTCRGFLDDTDLYNHLGVAALLQKSTNTLHVIIVPVRGDHELHGL